MTISSAASAGAPNSRNRLPAGNARIDGAAAMDSAPAVWRKAASNRANGAPRCGCQSGQYDRDEGRRPSRRPRPHRGVLKMGNRQGNRTFRLD